MGFQQGQEENIRMQRSQMDAGYGEGLSALTGGWPESEKPLLGDTAGSQGPLGQPRLMGESPPQVAKDTA